MSKIRTTISVFTVLSASALVLNFSSVSFGAGEPVIGTVTASANYDNWGGKCPKQFIFTGQMTANAQGIINYHWERSDGATGPSKIARVKPGQTITVRDTWKLGAAGEKITISETLVAESGNQHIKAKSQDIPIQCK
jgi:hypothetical protein